MLLFPLILKLQTLPLNYVVHGLKNLGIRVSFQTNYLGLPMAMAVCLTGNTLPVPSWASFSRDDVGGGSDSSGFG